MPRRTRAPASRSARRVSAGASAGSGFRPHRGRRAHRASTTAQADFAGARYQAGALEHLGALHASEAGKICNGARDLPRGSVGARANRGGTRLARSSDVPRGELGPWLRRGPGGSVDTRVDREMRAGKSARGGRALRGLWLGWKHALRRRLLGARPRVERRARRLADAWARALCGPSPLDGRHPRARRRGQTGAAEAAREHARREQPPGGQLHLQLPLADEPHPHHCIMQHKVGDAGPDGRAGRKITG